ncbi:cytochrome b5-like heme/steroid binding domain-containing protein [Poronia punctata]|nr:cytochrome b5-like heme/steroid binding domain-containing protein [Poronia punctata]
MSFLPLQDETSAVPPSAVNEGAGHIHPEEAEKTTTIEQITAKTEITSSPKQDQDQDVAVVVEESTTTTTTTTVIQTNNNPSKEKEEEKERVLGKKYSVKEVGGHNSKDSLWLVIDGEVFDVTGFVDEHPGGMKVLNGVAGKDATKKFDKYHRRAILERYKPRLQIGIVDNDAAAESGRKKLFGRFSFGGKK